MAKVFEDEFVDMQAGIVGAFNEMVEESVDKIYVYCAMETRVQAVHAFFEKQGKIVTAGQLKIPVPQQMEFMAYAREDMQSLEKVCQKHGKPVPAVMKMIYDARTGAFEAEYNYEEVISKSKKKGFDDFYGEWKQEVTALVEGTQAEPQKPKFRFPFFGKK